MSPRELALLFHPVAAGRMHERLVDAKRVLRIDAGALGAQARVLRMVFRTGRIGPHDVRVESSHDAHTDAALVLADAEPRSFELRRARPGLHLVDADQAPWVPEPGEFTWDALIPAGNAAVTVRWFEPYEGASILRIGEALIAESVADAPDAPTNVWYDADEHPDIEAYKQAKAGINASGSLSDMQKRAARFWLSLDLCTSLANPSAEGDAVAAELGIEATHIKIDTTNRKWLTNVLKQRWMTRANCAAAGIPFELVFYEIPGDARDLAIDVGHLISDLLDTAFDRVDDQARVALAEFACGRLRRPGVGARLNVEPNSFNMAAFAEVADLASVTDGNSPKFILERLDGLRRLFVAMIEPFIETYVYRPPPDGDRHSSAYLFQNLGIKPGTEVGGDWIGDRLEKHVALLARLPEETFRERWGATLVKGLAAETSVEAAVKWHGKNPAPLNAASLQRGKALIERELERDQDGAADA